MTDTLTHDQLDAIKQRQQATWASGDYARIGTTLQLVGESLCEAVDVQAGWHVLDVAAGNGNASLAAARRGCEVTASDYVPDLPGQAAARAAAENATLVTDVADAEHLPYGDATFDAVLSTFGVMFTPDPMQAASELLRVCRPGGRIGLANWHPAGFIGGMFKIIGAHVPPPAGVPSPMTWGMDEHLHERFAGHRVEITRRQFVFRYRSAEDFFDTFIAYYGPTVKAWAALDDDGKASLRSQLVGHTEAGNRNRAAGPIAVPSDYVEVVVTKA